MEFILASLSPRRSDLLRSLRIPFRVVPPRGVDESAVSGAPPDVAARLALLKAEAVLSQLEAAGGRTPEILVIAADTVVELDGEIFGKPRERSEARSMLVRLGGRTHSVITGVCVSRAGGRSRVETETSEVTFRPLSAEDIEEYLSTGDFEGKAGAYGIQSEGHRLVSGFRGCFYNIVGLPLKRLLRMCREECGAFDFPADSCDCEAHPLWRGGEGCRAEAGM